MKMPDLEFLKECVIESTKDDYENISTLEPEIRKWAEEERKAFSADALLHALDFLVREGRLGAFRFSNDQGCFVESSLDEVPVAELWFKSRKLH